MARKKKLTERAEEVMSFARDEADRMGSPFVTTGHSMHHSAAGSGAVSDLVLAATNRGVTCSRCGWTGTLHMGHECREIQIATLTRRVSELEAEREELLNLACDAIDVLQDATVAQIPPATEMLRVRLDKFLPTLDEARAAFSGPPNTEGGA